jgi:DNA-binding NtrC family response regulator
MIAPAARLDGAPLHPLVPGVAAGESLIGDSATFRRCVEEIELAAPGVEPVLLAGEPGSGRRLLARTLHARSGRGGPPVVFDCGGTPHGRVEAELLDGGRLSHPGTLLLVEVGALPLGAQARLAAALARGPRARVVATAGREPRRLHHDLQRVFRPRTLVVPRLRDRPDDVPVLVQHVMTRASAALGRAVNAVSPEVMAALVEHDWPGNVRELEQVIEAAIYGALPDQDILYEIPVALAGPRDEPLALPATVRPIGEVQHQLLLAALKQHHGNVPRVARSLGVSRGTIYNLMRKYHVDPSSFRA